METDKKQFENENANSLLDHALKYAQKGLAIFPVHSIHTNGSISCSCGNSKCSNAGKHPRTKNGLKDATTDIETIRKWWTQWPNANIGLATGSINNILVLDVDPIHGGSESLIELENEYGTLPKTPTVKTGSNGRHFIFKAPSLTQKNTHGFKSGLDIKCEGGYIVAAPSLHKSGNHYEWMSGLDIFSLSPTDCPPWLLKLIDSSEVKSNEIDLNLNEDIPEGTRNDTLFKFGCTLRKQGYGEQELHLVLLGKNQSSCKPPLDANEVKQICNQVIKTVKKRDTVELINEHVSLFHDSEQKAYASITVNDHKETYPVHSKQFKNWISKQYYDEKKDVLKDDQKRDLLSILEAKARYEGQRQDVFTRIGGDSKKIYVDLANENWEVVEIDGDGWRVIKDSPVKFTRGNGMLPLPNPEAGGSIELLKPFLNISKEEDWILILGWLVSSYRPTGPYLIKTFMGEQGCAKSTQSKLLRSLIDPYKAALRVMPSTERDLFISASKSWIQVFDNLSGMSHNMADALCRLSTGGGLATRKLHSDDEEVIFEVTRPTILNGISEASSRPDLIDRSVLLELPVIPKTQRRREREYWQDFEKIRPKLLGALFSAVSASIRNLGKVEIKELPRMADVVEWVSAAEPALGLESGSFLEAYNSNRSSAIYDSLEASNIAAAIEELLGDKKQWQGTATALLKELNKKVDQDDLDKRNWPKNGQVLSGRLRRDAPGLREKGISVEWGKDGQKGRYIILKREDNK